MEKQKYEETNLMYADMEEAEQEFQKKINRGCLRVLLVVIFLAGFVMAVVAAARCL